MRGNGTPDERLERAWSALEDGDAELALSAACALIEELGEEPDLLVLSASARAELGGLDEAERELRRALSAEADHADARAALAELLFSTCRFSEARKNVARLRADAPDDPRGHDLAARLAERDGNLAEADAAEREAHRLDPESFPLVARLSREEFDACVEAAYGALPDAFRERLTNVAVTVTDVPSSDVLQSLDDPAPDLLGLFVGVPLPDKRHDDLPGPPDTVFLFKRNLERASDGRDELVREIRITLLHEIGHFMGLDEDQIEEAGFG